MIDKDIVKNAADFCSTIGSTYSPNTKTVFGKRIVENFKVLGFIPVSVEVYLIGKGRDLYIIFEGSNTVSDWFTNFVFWFSSSKCTHGNSRARVHSGFLRQFGSIKQKLRAYLGLYKTQNNNPDNVILCGHSLGGALATLCGYHFCSLQPKWIDRTSIITFGAPRVGNKYFFIDYTKTFLGRYLHFNNRNDYVSLLPPLPWYRKLNLTQLNRDRKFPYASVKDHQMSSYLKEIFEQYS